MTRQEREMLAELFERVRAVAAVPRDAEAETAVAQATRDQPYAAYVLAQTAIVQRHALDAAAQRILELEARLAPPASSPSFLGDLGQTPLRPDSTPASAPGGGFLASAMTNATGVAGGMLAASAIEHLLLGERGGGPVGETANNNVHESAPGLAATPADIALPDVAPDQAAFVDPADYEADAGLDDVPSNDDGVDV
jgi:hypothetical protein